MSYRADKLVTDARTDTHTQTDAGNNNTLRSKLASSKNERIVPLMCIQSKLYNVLYKEILSISDYFFHF